MGYILKFRSPNLYTIIIITKVKKGLLKKKETVKSFFIFMTMLSFKQVESNFGKKEPCERGCSWIINFLLFEFWIPLIWYYFFNLNSKLAYTLHSRRKKSVKWTTFDAFLRRVNFILMFLQEELASLLSVESQHASFSSLLSGFDGSSFLFLLFCWVYLLIKVECTVLVTMVFRILVLL